MSDLKLFVILIIFGTAAVRSKTNVHKNFNSDSEKYKIFIDQQQLNEDYELLLSELAKNRSKNYEIDVVLSSKGCPVCDRTLGTIMKASLQSFLTIDDTSAKHYSGVAQDEVIPYIGYYKFVLFLTENVLEFFQHFANLRSHFAWNPRARHLIFAAEKPANEELEMIFEKCWSRKILNVAVITKNDRKAFTYNPYFENQRRKKEEVDWSRLFYDKLKNMNGFPIRIKYAPYSDNSVKKWIQEGKRLKFFGYDFGYAEALCKSVNATSDYVNLTVDTVHLYSNYSYRYRLWNDRQLGVADLWANTMTIDAKLEHRCERSYPVRQSGLGILVPKSGHKAPSIFEPYQDVTWTCLVASLITFALYSNVFNKLRGINDNAFLRTFGIFLGKNLANRRLEFLEKFTFIIFTTFSLLIVNAYQGALYGALAAVSYHPEVDTILELNKRIKTIHTFPFIVRNFRVYTDPSIEVVPFDSRDYIEYMRAYPDDAFVLPDDLARYDVQRKVLSRNGVPLFHVMRDYVMPGFHDIVSRYGSPYFEKVDRVLMACREAGLDDYWMAESKFQDLLLGTIIIPDDTEEKTLKKLSLRTQLTSFCIWGVGLLASFLCCAAEILFHKYGGRIMRTDIHDTE